MNKKGQALVFIVLLIPFILAIIAVVFDVSLMYKEQNKLELITKEAFVYLTSNKSVEEVREIIIDNDSDIVIESIDNSSVCLTKDINSVFGKVLGFNKYHLKSNMPNNN